MGRHASIEVNQCLKGVSPFLLNNKALFDYTTKESNSVIMVGLFFIQISFVDRNQSFIT